MITIKKGLDVPISGAPPQQISTGKAVKTVAVIGPDYIGMKPTMAVREGDKVALGQTLFEDKKTPGVIYTAPAAGTVTAINRGDKRALLSVVIEIDENGEQNTFTSYSQNELGSIDREAVVKQLVDSGQWVAFRSRPFSKVPAIDSAPVAIFLTATDTNPLAVDPAMVIAEYNSDFQAGVEVLTNLTEGKVFVCTGDADVAVPGHERVQLEKFTGVHPAGNAGTHIHHLRPASLEKMVWTIGYQEVIAIGSLFTTGKIWCERVISIGGPQVKEPKIIKTRLGANLDELTEGELKEGDNRVVSGSILNGRKADGALAFLGRYHNQVSVLEEGTERPMLHYCVLGKNRFSALPIYISNLLGRKSWDFTTTTNGSERAMVPVGAYEKVMPLDILPTQLLRSLIVGDTAMAQQLGALELDEEDLALCTFVCPGKYEYGPILRDNLDRIEREG
jgi:Na+-transporting NADH:ubiquinone oxidoreductase subunit A